MEHYFTNNENLPSEIRNIKYDYESYNFMFDSDIGVFSNKKIDFGSKLLVETFLQHNSSTDLNVLDVGCGYGFMGIVIAKVTNSKVDMVDINKRAINLSEINIKKNKVQASTFLSNAYEYVTNEYDVIITNPPIRAGKSVILDILGNAKNHLGAGGELWFVIRKDHGAKSVIKCLENDYICEIIIKSKGFFIVMAKKR